MSETCSVWVLKRHDRPDRYFGSVYPELAESYESMEARIAFWEVADE